MRVKDAVEYVWWFSKTDWPKADNTRVLGEYSADMHRLIARGFHPKKRPSGWNIKAGFGKDHDGSIPPNVIEENFLDGRDLDVATNIIERGNNERNSEYSGACQAAGLKPHPARFPRALPEFFIKLHTEGNDLVVDPFSGSNMTGAVAEDLGRRWLGFELREDYLAASAIRFNGRVTLVSGVVISDLDELSQLLRLVFPTEGVPKPLHLLDALPLVHGGQMSDTEIAQQVEPVRGEYGLWQKLATLRKIFWGLRYVGQTPHWNGGFAGRSASL